MARIRFGAAIVALALVANPAFGADGPRPTFRTEQTYFTCPGPTKVHQPNWVLAVFGQTTNPSWTTEAPSGSVQQGEGCGSLDWGGTTNALYGPAFVGTFEGNLRNLTVRVHQFVTGNVRQKPTETLRMYAEIDGQPLFPRGAQPNNGRTVTVTPTLQSNGAVEYYEFSITNIGYAKDVVDGDGNVIGSDHGGAAYEDGNGDDVHDITIYLGVHGTAFGQDPSGHKAATWAWDTTEVPGGITFNPPTLAAAKVAADLPNYSAE